MLDETDLEVFRVCEDYVVTGQIQPNHLTAIKEAGFKSVLCTRPDGEDPGQVDFQIVASAAAELGMECRKIDVYGHIGITTDNVQAFVDAWEELPRPIFGYCRSGNRAAVLYRASRSLG